MVERIPMGIQLLFIGDDLSEQTEQLLLFPHTGRVSSKRVTD